MSDWVREDRACEQMGVSRATVKRLRDSGTMVEGEHWRTKSNRIELSRAGVAAIGDTLGLEPGECTAVVLWVQPKVVPVRVIRMTRNTKIVVGEPTETVRPEYMDAERVRLRVPDSRRVCIGLVVAAEHVRDDLWEAVGRIPRGRREAARWAMRDN